MLSRRRFLAAAAVAPVAAGWMPIGRLTLATADDTFAPPPPALPADISLYLDAFKNWSGQIVADTVWTCTPSSPEQVVELANWAFTNGYRLRPRGYSHNWSPLTIPPGTTSDDRVLLVDTTEMLTAITVSDGQPASVTAQAGASMEAILTVLEEHGYGLNHNPAPGDLTIGGVLAIDGHGTAVPADGETLTPGHTFGSLSNLVLSMAAVVWDEATGAYALRTFQRTDQEIGALMAHVGRAFVTEVTLIVGQNARVRCESFLGIAAREMFAKPGSTGRTIEHYLAQSGRVEAIWFPFTTNPWLKVWTKTPEKPPASREVEGPFNYTFSDTLPAGITDLIAQIQTGAPRLAVELGKIQWATVGAGLSATNTWDIWGWSKNTSLYVRPATLRVTANGYAITCRRADVQRVIHEFTELYRSKVADYRALGRYPMNGPVEIRVTGLDNPGDVGITGARVVQLSATRPRPDHPDWDCAVWLDILTLPRTRWAEEFYREVEHWCLTNYTGDYAGLRVEWSKGWGYTDDAAWTDPAVIGGTIPASLTDGQPHGQQFADARTTLNALDPHRIYTTPLLDMLLGP
jgi:FAD/FMN-containing dehydrogenase